jgi:phospholipase C
MPSHRRRRLAIAVLVFIPTLGAVMARPAPQFTTPVQHIVVIYQENHSFDEVLGAFCRATPGRCNGFTGTVTLKDGTRVAMTQSPDVVPQATHAVASQAADLNGGAMNGWAQPPCTAQNRYQCLTYYTPAQIPNLAALATNFAVSDATFSLAGSPSWGGHLYAAASDLDSFTGANPRIAPGVTPGPGWGCDSNKVSPWVNAKGAAVYEPSCIPDPALGLPNGGAFRPTPVRYTPTIMDSLEAASLSWKLYAQGGVYGWAMCPSFAECLHTGQASNMVPTTAILSDARSGTLPNWSVVLPAGSNSQHNGMSMLQGDNWIGQVVAALEAGPEWSSTAVFITYDDCGCFYDHVAPPRNPDGTQQGPRLPLVIVSPYARAGFTDSTPATFASILAFTEHSFALPALGANDGAAYDFAAAFNYKQPGLRGVPMRQSPIPPGESTVPVPADDPS